jgi:hypothetical protein
VKGGDGQAPLPLSPKAPQPKKTGSSATAPCAFRATVALKAAGLDICDRKPEKYRCVGDLYLAGYLLILEHEATGGDDPVLATVNACRLTGEIDRVDQMLTEGLEKTIEVVKRCVARGLSEEAHEVYGAQMEHFLKIRHAGWRKEAVRLMEAQVKPLLPKRNALNLRIVAKDSNKS